MHLFQPRFFSWGISLLLQSLQYMPKPFNLAVHTTNQGLLLYHFSEISEISFFWVRVVYKIRLVSYGSKQVLQPHFDATFCCTCSHNSKTTCRIGTFYIPNDCSPIGNVYFLFRAWCKIRLARYGSKHVLQSGFHAGFFLGELPIWPLTCWSTVIMRWRWWRQDYTSGWMMWTLHDLCELLLKVHSCLQ